MCLFFLFKTKAINRPVYHISIFLILTAFTFSAQSLFSQQPFTCLDQVFIIGENGGELIEMSTDPGSSILNFDDLNTNLGVPIDAAGFRSTDGLIYAIGNGDNHLYQLDATGAMVDLGQLSLNPNYSYLAGAMTPDGQFLVAIGSDGSTDIELAKIDFSNNYSVQNTSLSGFASHTDIAFDPLTEQLFGFDSSSRKISTISLNSGNVNLLAEIGTTNEITGVFFNAFGELHAFGTALNGVVSASFKIDEMTGAESLLRTSGLRPLVDVAACPFTIGIRCAADPQSSFPCNEIQFSYTISNATNSPQAGIDFSHELSTGFEILNVSSNPFGGTIDPTTPTNTLKINDLNITEGIKTMNVSVYIDDIPSGAYRSKARIENIPNQLGPFIGSDDPSTSTFGDSTHLEINRFDEDSLFFDQFLCLNQTTILNASDYGNNLLWNNGNTSPMLQVGQAGTYTLEAISGCQTLFVSYEVVTASCPYTIEVLHSIFPDTIFPCDEVVFRYYFDNDSGLERTGINLIDTLPFTFNFIEVRPNPYGGVIKNGLPPNIIHIEDMTLIKGFDSIDVVVEIGDINPGNYFNAAEISGLPSLLGNQRFSDDPSTPILDDTRLVILGVESDTSYVDTVICLGEALWLDARPYGTSPIWPDGTTTDQWQVEETGFYELQIFDGCEPSLVYFNVEIGPDIQISVNPLFIDLHLGDSIQLLPTLVNSGDSLSLLWNDPLENSLSCIDCPTPLARPLESTTYTFWASNELCTDELSIKINVDNTRRIYAPTAFSPNNDGINDYFYLHTPDPAFIHDFKIFNRWGAIVFENKNIELNIETDGWNGVFKNKKMDSGIYLWMAEIEFIDGRREAFKGDFILVK